jgi:uncharacterized protein YraI
MRFRPPRALVVAATLAVGLFAPAAAMAQNAYTTADVNMRAGPGTQFERVATLAEGTGVDVEDCDGAWCRVIYRGIAGYVSQSYLDGMSERPAVVVPPPVYVPPPVVVYPPYRPGWRPPHRPRPPGWRPPPRPPWVGPRPPIVRPPIVRPPIVRPPISRPPGGGWGGNPGGGGRPPVARPPGGGRPDFGRPSGPRPGGGRPGGDRRGMGG